eukprot:9918142-Heterocapsa_arctica.AAC.1
MPEMRLNHNNMRHGVHWATEDALRKAKNKSDRMDSRTMDVACFETGVYRDGATVSSFQGGDIVTIGVAIDCRMLNDPSKGNLVHHIGSHPEIIRRFVAHDGFPAWLDE